MIITNLENKELVIEDVQDADPGKLNYDSQIMIKIKHIKWMNFCHSVVYAKQELKQNSYKRAWDIKFLGKCKKLISINYLIEISFWYLFYNVQLVELLFSLY